MDTEYSNIETFQDLLDLYKSFLNGKINEVPTHSDKLDPESELILPQLIAMNSYGFLTIISQPGMLTKNVESSFPPFGPPWMNHTPYLEFKSPTEIYTSQRQHVAGFMSKNLFRSIKSSLILEGLLVFSWNTDQFRLQLNIENYLPLTIAYARTDDKDYVHPFTTLPMDGSTTLGVLEILKDAISQEAFQTIFDDMTSDMVYVEIVDPNWISDEDMDGKESVSTVDMFDYLVEIMEQI